MKQKNNKQLNIPKLRFSGFNEKWEKDELREFFIKKQDKNINLQYTKVLTNSAIKGIVDQSDYFDKDIANQDNLGGYFVVDVNDFVYNPRISGQAPVGPLNRNKIHLGVMSPLYTVLKPKNINFDFFEYYFFTKKWHRYMYKIANYGARHDRMSILQSDFMVMPIIYPQKEEQQKIADFLSFVDNWINNLKQQKENLESYKKGIMQKIFSREIRFKDENDEEFEEWKEKKIKDIFIVTRGYVLSMNNVKNSKVDNYIYPVYSSQTMNNGLAGYYDKFLYENAITWTTDGANAGNVNFREGRFYCTNVCGVLISKDGYANKFISELLNSIAYKHVSRVGNPKLMNNVMSEIKIKSPCVKEQQKIADFLSNIDNLIGTKEKEINNIEEWKRGLMQQMFI